MPAKLECMYNKLYSCDPKMCSLLKCSRVQEYVKRERGAAAIPSSVFVREPILTKTKVKI